MFPSVGVTRLVDCAFWRTSITSLVSYEHIEAVVNARRNNGRALNGRCRQQQQHKFTLDIRQWRRRDDID